MSDLENGNSGQELRRRRVRRLRRRVRVGWARRWVPRLILALALAVFGAYRVLTDPARVQRLTQAYVQQFFATPVTIGAVDFSLTTGIRLSDVQVSDPDGGARPAMLAIEGMWLQHDPFELLVGRVAVDEIVATRPVCRARFAADVGKFNIQRVLRAPPAEGKGGLRQLPVLRVRDAHLEIYADAEPATAAIEDVALSLTATPDSAGRRYDVAWVAQADRRSQGRFLVDLRAGVVEDQEDSGAPWLSLEAASLAIEATEPRAGRWIDLLGVRGHFRIVDFTLGFRGGHSGANRLTMEFENAGLSVPVEAMEDELPPARRFVRLAGVSGRVAVDAAGATANLYGRLGEAACRLRGRLLGDVQRETSFAELGFEVDADVEGLVLPRQDEDAPPREVRFIHRWERLSHFYRDFDPHGVVDLTASLRKAPGVGAPIELRRARIEARGADVAVRMFPYRVEDVRGTVEITPQGVYLHGLTGRHAGAAIAADGWFGAMSLRSQAELTIRGAGVALDDDLCAAISGRHRRTWERFGPRGFADLTVRMSRPEGSEGPEPWAIAIDADLLGVDAAFEGFPYPLRDLQGPVRIAGDTFHVDRVRGDCGAGTLVADGFVRTSPNGVEQLDLRLTADALPLDETLLAALPPASRAELADLHPEGTAAVTVDLTDRDGAVTYDIAAEVEGVDLCPEGFPLPIADLNGGLRIKPGVIELHDLRGAACDGGIRVDGRIVRGAEADSAVTIRGEQIRLTEALRAALPEAVRAQLAPWRIEGCFDVERRTGGPGGQTLRLELDGATIAHEDFTLPWRVATGDVIVERERVWLRGVRAVSGGAELTLEGEIDATGGRLEYTLRGLKLGEEFRMALPWRVRRQWNDLAPHGAVDVFDGLLAWRTDPASQRPVWQLAGAVQLHEVGFVAGLPVSGMTGTIDVGGEAPNGLSDVFLKGDMRLDRVQVGRYALENFTGRILRDGAGKRLRFDELRGALYGGAVSGELNIDGGRGQGEYSLEATVQRAGVEGFVRAHRPTSAAAEDQVQGYVDGRFFLTGKLSDPSQRRGGGRVQVRDAELYRLPLLLAVLHVINLAVPEASAFQSGSARLTIVGDEVRFRNLELTGEALSLVGGGTMAISTGALDLQLVTVSPHRWGNMPVVTEMLEGMTRELLEVQVRGTLGEPRATAQPLRNMEAVLEALLTMRGTPQEQEPVAPGEP